MAMIWSSLNRLFLTTPPLALAGHPKWEKSHFQWTIFWGAGHTRSCTRLGQRDDNDVAAKFTSGMQAEHSLLAFRRLGCPLWFIGGGRGIPVVVDAPFPNDGRDNDCQAAYAVEGWLQGTD